MTAGNKAKFWLPSLSISLVLFGCSGMVAPVNKGGTLGTSNENEKAAGSDATAQAGDNDGFPTMSSAPVATNAVVAANLGKFSESSGDAIKPVSGYAMYMDMGMLKSLSVVVTEGAVGENSFKKIVSWECKPCSGDNDPMCKTTTTTEVKIPASYSITFTKPFVPSETAVANENGWPKAAKTAFDAAKPESTFSSGLSAGGAAGTLPVAGTGSIDFGAAAPTKVGDKFTAIIDVDFGGKKHKTKLESTVVTMGTPVAPPADCTLANKKYPFPKYE